MPASLIGWWYATGPEDRDFQIGEPGTALYQVIEDISPVSGCVLVKGPDGTSFTVAKSLVSEISRHPRELKRGRSHPSS